MAQARLKRKPKGKPDAETEEQARARMKEILRILDREYPEAECSLTFKTPFQLLAATILSAQCTDERVNMTTPALFAKYPTAEAMARAPTRDLEKIIQSTGFFRSKAKSLQEASRALVERHGGEIPRTLEELVKLRGVGRKTANVVLGVAYGVPGLVVDTHVGRISRRLGFTKVLDPVKVERELMEVVVREMWTHYAHLMISHGRAICTARRAYCEKCPIAHLCPKIGVEG
ncbi:MAG TPA: endonuclease III [Bdellovibrionota bacterium]|nr:endonuclease III [Bdellovibrionota bacterium]